MIRMEIDDVDEIYSAGEYISSEKNVEGFEVVEKWLFDGKMYSIGRNYKDGESIILRVDRTKRQPKNEFWGFGITNRVTGTRVYVGSFNTRQEAYAEMKKREKNGKNARLVRRERFDFSKDW